MRINEEKVVYLEITTWAGISFGAEHYYGKLISCGKEWKTVEVSRKMTAKEARVLSKKDDFEWKAGSELSRFDTKDDVRETAKKIYRKEFPSAIVLLEGNPAYVKPKRVLDGSVELILLSAELLRKFEAIGGWSNRKYDKTAEKLTHRFAEAVNNYIEETERRNVNPALIHLS